MIVYRNIHPLKKDPRYVQDGAEKTPKFVTPEKANVPMSETGIYMIMEAEGGEKYQ